MTSNFKKDQKEWELVAEKAECEGPGWPYEDPKGFLSDVDSCAEACMDTSFMFTFGTNDFGWTRCPSHMNGCFCNCELLAHANGTCKKGLLASPGYRLYRIEKGKMSVVDVEFICKRNFYIRKSQLSLQIFLKGLIIFQVVRKFMSENQEPILKW